MADQGYEIDEWKIIERGFSPQNHKKSESIFSLGNGKFGQRANFEEHYSGAHMQGTYIAGVYYPDKTRVGWWKNGYPEYFAKVLNAPSWNGIDVYIDGAQTRSGSLAGERLCPRARYEIGGAAPELYGTDAQREEGTGARRTVHQHSR
jgi:trehalose/maltose hydrolase-like predicted phosphorylase